MKPFLSIQIVIILTVLCHSIPSDEKIIGRNEVIRLRDTPPEQRESSFSGATYWIPSKVGGLARSWSVAYRHRLAPVYYRIVLNRILIDFLVSVMCQSLYGL